MNILGIIPARYASTRFPGKPLQLIAGKPLIQHVVERCQKAWALSEIIVATDDERIREVAARCKCDGLVNIQGDEPLIDSEVINQVASALTDNEMSTAATPIKSPEDYDNPNVVKVVVNAAGRALYF